MMNPKSYYIQVTSTFTKVINLRALWWQRAGFVLLHAYIFLHVLLTSQGYTFTFDLSTAKMEKVTTPALP